MRISLAKNPCSATWLDKRLEIRKLQGEFWRSAREDWQQHQNDLQSEVVGAVIGHLSFNLSPAYLAEVHNERTAYEAEMQRVQAARPLKKEDTFVLQSVWGSEPENRKPVRTKTKCVLVTKDSTLGIEKLDINKEPPVNIAEESPKPRIAAKQDSKRVFEKMFSRTATVSNFRWSHLVNALTDAGMVATQAAGSAVRFKNDRGSIVFHAPHGADHDSTLSVDFLRYQIGKRLTKWFSWDAETFVKRTRDE